MDATDSVDKYLEHYGVKGMRWGVRRTRAQLDAASDDAAQAKATKATIGRNKGSTDPVSNKELQQLVYRMNLERQYSQLSQTPKSKGRRFVEKMIKNPDQRKKTIDSLSPLTDPIKTVIELRKDIERVRL